LADVDQDDAIIKGMVKGTEVIRDAAKRYVPVDSGALRDSLRLESKRGKLRKGLLSFGVVTGGRLELRIPANAKWYYPMVLEYGGLRGAETHETSSIRAGWTNRKRGKNYFTVRKVVERSRTGGTRIPARPYLRPAIDNNRPAILNAIADGIRQAILKVWGKKGMGGTIYSGTAAEGAITETMGRLGTSSEQK
jgi:hypothetical protein